MLKLTDETRYLPDLAEGYQWDHQIDDHGYIQVSVYRNFPFSAREKVSSVAVTVNNMDPEADIRAKVIAQSVKIASMPRPWNPEFAAKVWGALESLHAPTDDRVGYHGPEAEEEWH